MLSDPRVVETHHVPIGFEHVPDLVHLFAEPFACTRSSRHQSSFSIRWCLGSVVRVCSFFGLFLPSSAFFLPHLFVEEFPVSRPAEQILEALPIEVHHAQFLRRTGGHGAVAGVPLSGSRSWTWVVGCGDGLPLSLDGNLFIPTPIPIPIPIPKGGRMERRMPTHTHTPVEPPRRIRRHERS